MATILVAVFCAGEFESIKIREGQSLEWGYGFCAGMEVGALMYGGGVSAYVVPDEEARMRHEATAKRTEEIEKAFREAADIRAKLGAHDIDTNDGGLSVLGCDPESPRRQALKAETTEPNLIARLSLAIRKAWAAPPVGTSSEQAARAVIAELTAMGMKAHDMSKLAYVARSAFDRASAAGDEDPFKYVVERILLVASNVPTHAIKYATAPKQVGDEAGLPPRQDPAQGIVYRLARTIYSVEERARRPMAVLFDDLYAHTQEEYRSAARAVLADLTASGMDVLGGPLSGSDEMLETASDYAARAAAELWAKGWRAIIDGRNVNQKMYDAFQAGAKWAYNQVAPIIAAKNEIIAEQARTLTQTPASSGERWAVACQCDDAPMRLFTYSSGDEARIAFDTLNAQWSQTYLVTIVAGPHDNATSWKPPLPDISMELLRDRDAALAEVQRLEAEAEALRKHVRILEIAPKAAAHASALTGEAWRERDAWRAAEVMCRKVSTPVSPWNKAVLEYAAKEGALT